MRVAYKAENDKYWEEEKVFRDWYKEERRRKCAPCAPPCSPGESACLPTSRLSVAATMSLTLLSVPAGTPAP